MMLQVSRVFYFMTLHVQSNLDTSKQVNVNMSVVDLFGTSSWHSACMQIKSFVLHTHTHTHTNTHTHTHTHTYPCMHAHTHTHTQM